MYALIQSDDSKTRALAKELKNIELYRMKGSNILIPGQLINQILKRKKKPEAVILRYLNDTNSFIKSFIKFLSTLITVLLTKLLNIRLIWICHNVDKESHENFPTLSRLRRKVVSKLSNRILVTDKLLISHAARTLKVNQSKIDYITFGNPNPSETLNKVEDVHKRIINFIQNDKTMNTLVGLSIGSPNQKVLHPFYIADLIKNAKVYGTNIKIILGGPFGEFIKKNDINIYYDLLSNPNVLFIDGYIELNESYISQFVDFYWRAYNDYSVPFSIYSASHFRKPILTMNMGFLKEMVLEYNLGSILKEDMSNLPYVIEELNKTRTKSFDDFLRNHN